MGARGGGSVRGFGRFGVSKPVVSGGTLSSDDTYFYRTFTSNGTLEIAGSPLTCDVLIIGAGGACYSAPAVDPNGAGGGAGAGGAVYGVNRLIDPSSYAIVVGAGGSNSGGTGGNNSTFNSIIAKGGAGFRRITGNVPQTEPGGCGAGSNDYNPPFDNSSNQGTFSGYTSYGNRGGKNNTTDSYTGGKVGGGGGLGGYIDFGGGPGNSTEVRGGPGLNTWSTWATVTGTGVSGFYGGGGGGHNGYVGGPFLGGSGGGGNGNNPATNGVANTGSGGGATYAGGFASPRVGGNGGSGLVIVRYTKLQVA